MIRLHNHTSVPPGEYVIRVVHGNGDWSETHAVCGGSPDCVQFGPSPLINQVAKDLMAFLKANKLPRSSFAECVQLIDSYTCTRIGNKKQFCYDTEKRVADTSPTVMAAQGKCGSCGVRL